MAKPLNSTVTIDGNFLNSLATHIGVHTRHDHTGMPLTGTSACTISCTIDAHDEGNLPFATLKSLWELANQVTREKIKDIKIEFWKDESQQDAICTYQFKGWISNFSMDGGGGGNHIVNLELQPALDPKQFIDITLGN